MPDRGNLVISRKSGTKLLIGDDIEITFVGFRSEDGTVLHPAGLSVTVAIKAPKSVRVLRYELDGKGWRK